MLSAVVREHPNLKRPWREIATEAQTRRENSIAALGARPPDVPVELPLNVTGIPDQLLPSDENEITAGPAEVLLRRLASGSWSASKVTTAFLRRAVVAQGLTNCLTDLLPRKALERAAYLDEYFKRHGRPLGPLHGLPISVKEQVGMKGLDLNMAFCGFYGSIANENALILQILWNAGAVFHARTTGPQLLMHLETNNNLYGVTVNPFNTRLTAGGSSGGEGALIGLRGSILGIGTDIGGSIRSPAANCGMYGFKMTSRRLPLRGVGGEESGYESILGVVGPLSTSLEGIKLFSKTIIDAKPWLKDPSLIPLPWTMDQQHLRPTLRIAVMWDDGIVKPHPPILRALKETVAKLKLVRDIDVVDWLPYKHEEAWRIIASLYFPDGGEEESDIINGTGEPWLPLSNFIMRDNPFAKPRTSSELQSVTSERDEYRAAHYQHWNQTATSFDAQGMPLDAVDVILCPVGPGAAPPLNCSRYWCYTSQWNLLDQPALVFPVSTVDQQQDVKDLGYTPRNDQDKYNYDLYSPERYVDAPISLQLVGRRYEEEKVIQAFERIQMYL